MDNRRQFLKKITTIGLGIAGASLVNVNGILANEDTNIHLFITHSNDWWNTIIPYKSILYKKKRNSLRQVDFRVIDNQWAISKYMPYLFQLFKENKALFTNQCHSSGIIIEKKKERFNVYYLKGISSPINQANRHKKLLTDLDNYIRDVVTNNPTATIVIESGYDRGIKENLDKGTSLSNTSSRIIIKPSEHTSFPFESASVPEELFGGNN